MSDDDPFREDFRIEVPTLVITGPTAGGKAGLAIRIAQHLRCGALSLDSMKVYRGMDVGTAKPKAEVRASVPFHLMDLRDPWETFSVGDYLDEVRTRVPRLGARLLFAGGTAFYLNTLLRGIFRGPPPDPEYREQLWQEAEERGVAVLHQRLAQGDPPSAERIQPTDRRRIIRALEVMRACDEPFSVLQARRQPILPASRGRLIGIGRSRAELYERIDRRVERMFDLGWVEEVNRLCAAHDPPWSPQADQSIGYQQIRKALELGESPRDRLPVIQQRTRHFARHQLIWFRKMPIEWWRPDEEAELLRSIDRSFEHYEREGSFPSPPPERLKSEHL